MNEDDTVAFLHRLKRGGTTSSFAHFIAKMADLDEDVVKRSVEVSDNLAHSTQNMIIRRETVIIIIKIYTF